MSDLKSRKMEEKCVTIPIVPRAIRNTIRKLDSWQVTTICFSFYSLSKRSLVTMTFEESLPEGKKSCHKVQKSKARPRGIYIPKADFLWF